MYPALLQRAEEETMMRASVTLVYVPETWRQTNVVFISKVGRSSCDSVKDFWPMSLIFFILKTLEKLADRYLRNTMLVEHPILRVQHV